MCGDEDRGTLETRGKAVSCRGGINSSHKLTTVTVLVPKGLVFADALTVGLTKKHQLQGQNSAPTSGPQPSHVAPGGGRAIVYMQYLEHYTGSPCQVRKEMKSWEDPTRSNVTCQDPTWTSFLSINSNFGSSQISRQVPE